jgi:hypothetical protein
VLAQEGQATTATASANDRGEACVQSIEKDQPLHDARVEQYRARELRLRAGCNKLSAKGMRRIVY